MKTKTKLAGIVIAFMLALSAMVVGIWAVSTATVNLGGNISFTADDIYAKITGKIENAEGGTITFNELNYSATTEGPSEADLNTWKGKNLNFADKNTDIVLTITIENLSSERSLDVKIKDTIGAQTNLNKSVSFKNGSQTEVTSGVLDTKYTIPAGTGNSATYTITLSIDNKNNSVQADYGYNLVLNDENYVAPPEIKVVSNDTSLGSVTGGVEGVNDGDEITLTATPTSGSTFMGWAVEKNEFQTTSNEEIISAQATEILDASKMQVVSTDARYTFTYSADKPTTYYALFNNTTETNVTSGDLKYTIYKEAKLATITSGSSATGDIEIPSTININETEYLVYLIGTGAFSSCSNLTSIKIPNSVISIGNYSFINCNKLTSVSIGSSVESIGANAFSRCSTLTSINIPDSVKSISDYAFQYCSGLPSVTIGSKVASIGKDAFNSCSVLTSVNIPDSVTNIGSNAFQLCSGLTSVTIGSGMISIETGVFGNCSRLTSVAIGNSIASIGEWAFYNCSALSSITIPNSVAIIGDYAFNCCSVLTSITIPDSVTSIGDAAFQNCTSLEIISIPDSVKSIGYNAFSCCSSLTSVTFENTSGWWVSTDANATSGDSVNVTDTSLNATYLKTDYVDYYWKRG